MDAVEFLRTRRKLCDDNVCGESCPLFYCCDDDVEDNRIRQVLVVEKWGKEHPVKTRQSELLKLFPEAIMLCDEYLNICPAQLSSECRDKETGGCYAPGMDCVKCKRDFWLKEIE